MVDDTPADVEFTLHALQGLGLPHRVVVARDGSEALEMLLGSGAHAGADLRPIACVLLDLKMPKVDGFEVLRRVKRDPALSAIPVVVLTSSGESRDVEEAYRLGANAYVVKPMEFEDFVAAVKDCGRFWAVVNQPPRHV